jgi:hypothetical protein
VHHYWENMLGIGSLTVCLRYLPPHITITVETPNHFRSASHPTNKPKIKNTATHFSILFPPKFSLYYSLSYIYITSHFDSRSLARCDFSQRLQNIGPAIGILLQIFEVVNAIRLRMRNGMRKKPNQDKPKPKPKPKPMPKQYHNQNRNRNQTQNHTKPTNKILA